MDSQRARKQPGMAPGGWLAQPRRAHLLEVSWPRRKRAPSSTSPDPPDDPVADRAAPSWRALFRWLAHHHRQRARLFCHPSRIRLDLIRVSWI